VHRDLADVLAGLDADESARLWAGTAQEFYRLAPSRLAAAAVSIQQ